MKRKAINGGCYCGAVRFSAAGRTLHRANCHCANCRRAAGAQAVAWITVRSAGFKFKKGKPKRFRTDTKAWRTFCGICGTSLTYENDARPGEMDVTTGSLDSPEAFAPSKDVFAEERPSWVPLISKKKAKVR